MIDDTKLQEVLEELGFTPQKWIDTTDSYRQLVPNDIPGKIDVNICNKYEESPLMLARTAEQTKLLIEAGASIEMSDRHGETAIFYANTEQTKILLEAGANINVMNDNEQTALFDANFEKAKLLIEAGIDVNAEDERGYTALFFTNSPKKASLLIEAGADVNARSEDLSTPLMLAKTAEKTKLLIKAGADVNACDEYLGTPLMYAQTAEQTKLLIEAGADVFAKDKYGNTALQCCETDEQKNIIEAAMNNKTTQKNDNIVSKIRKLQKEIEQKQNPKERVSDTKSAQNVTSDKGNKTISPELSTTIKQSKILGK